MLYFSSLEYILPSIYITSIIYISLHVFKLKLTITTEDEMEAVEKEIVKSLKKRINDIIDKITDL